MKNKEINKKPLLTKNQEKNLKKFFLGYALLLIFTSQLNNKIYNTYLLKIAYVGIMGFIVFLIFLLIYYYISVLNLDDEKEDK